MDGITFHDLADYLRHGREVEFAYRRRAYSITNHSGYWQLCDDTAHILMQKLCSVEEKEILVSKVAAAMIGDLTIQQIFDGQFYDKERLYIL